VTQWRTAQLGEVVELAYGKSLPKNQRASGAIPVYGSNGVSGWNDTALVNEPTVIVGRKGSAGAVQYVDQPCFPIDTTYFVRPRNGYELDMKFVYYLLRRLNLPRLATATGVPGLTREDAYRESISVPNIEEQRRIVDVLARAEGIVHLRREAQQKAAELIPSLFLDLFGDPATNPKHWPLAAVGDLIERFEGGKNLQAGEANNAKYRILKISAVTSGRYIEEEAKPAPPEIKPPASHLVRVGDLLISRANTEALVGAVALVEATGGTTLLPDKLWRFIWKDENVIISRFALHLFQQPAVRCMLSRIASGTGGSMKNISQAKLKLLRLPIPPIELQRHFAAKAETVRSIAAQQSAALSTAQAIFNALLHRAFVG